MGTVRQLLAEKGAQVWTIGPDDTVYEAIRLMADENVGALLVMEDGRPVGLITEREYARHIALEGRASRDTEVGEIMLRSVVYARPEQSIEEAMAVMTEKRVRHLPVLDDGRVVGLISIGDLVKAIIAEQRFVIDQLAHYISGDID
jgi:CBS domain-containing protein